MAAAQDLKRAREEHELAADEAPAKRAKGPEQTPLLSVPAMGDSIEASTLLPVVQQLLSVYKVEFWALLEELRVKRHEYCEAGRHLVPNTADEPDSSVAPAAASAATQGSMRQLIAAARGAAAGQSTAEADDVVLVAEHNKDATQQEHQQQSGIAYGDERCGYGKQDEQQPSFSESEAALLTLQPGSDTGCVSRAQLQSWHNRFKGASAAIAGLEQLASAATTQHLDAQGGLACLCGAAGRWVIRRTAISIGRSSDSKGDVDVDLGKAAPQAAVAAAAPPSAAAGGTTAAAAGATTPAAGPAAAAADGFGSAGAGGAASGAAAGGLRSVSRLQAQLSLRLDGCWTLRNTGRAAMAVNGKKVPRGSKVLLPHLSLLEIAGEPLLFMINGMAVQRAVARSSQLVM